MNDANIARKASANLLAHTFASLAIETGFIIKGYRGYKRSGKPNGRIQEDIERDTGFAQGRLSSLENGKNIPDDATLVKVLTACGFDLKVPTGQAVLATLKLVRDHRKGIDALAKEKPL